MADRKKKKHFVVAISEDGYVSLYGPYGHTKARDVAESIQLDDTSGNTITEVRKPEKKYIPYED